MFLSSVAYGMMTCLFGLVLKVNIYIYKVSVMIDCIKYKYKMEAMPQRSGVLWSVLVSVFGDVNVVELES
jgi:hypothetical protein